MPTQAAFSVPIDVQREVYASFPKFVPRKRREELAEAELSKIAAANPAVLLNRPILKPQPRGPSIIPIGAQAPQSVESEAQLLETEVVELLANPAGSAELPEPAVVNNLAAIAGISLRRGKPQILRGAITRIGGTATLREFDSYSNELQQQRGEDGRFASPEAASLGAAVLVGAKLQMSSMRGLFQDKLKPSSFRQQLQLVPEEREEKEGEVSREVVQRRRNGAPVTGGSAATTEAVGAGAPTTVQWTSFSGLGSIDGPIMDWFSDAWDKISDWVKDRINGLEDWFNGLPGDIKDLWSSVQHFVTEVGSWFSDSFNEFSEWFVGLAEKARDEFIRLCKNVAEAAVDAWNTVKGWISRLENLVAWLGECADDIVACVLEGVTWLAEWLLNIIGDLIEKFLKNALRALVWIFGELGKAIAGKLSQLGSQVEDWIEGEFKNPLDDVIVWLWKSAWEPLYTGIICLCEKACIRPVAKNLKEASNPWVSLVGTILWYLYPLLQGADNDDGFPGEDLRAYSFCRWIYQGGEGMLPNVELEGAAKDIFDYVTSDMDAVTTPKSGEMYSKYLVDRVARRYAAQELLGLGPNAPGVDGASLGRGPATAYVAKERTALWYARHPQKAEEHSSSGITGAMNPWPARIGMRARNLAEYMVENYCDQPASWIEWLGEQKYIHEIPGKPPRSGCTPPLGASGGGQYLEGAEGRCIYPFAWYQLFRAAKKRLGDNCFDLNAPEKYEKLLSTAVFNWSLMSEYGREASRRGSVGDEDVLEGFGYDKICPSDKASWLVPRDAGEPSIWDMGWPSWQGTGVGYQKHPGSNATMRQYWAYYMDWLEANSRDAVEPLDLELVGAGQADFPEVDLRPAPSRLELSSGLTLWESVQLHRSAPRAAEIMLEASPADSRRGSAQGLSGLGATSRRGAPTQLHAGVGYERAHLRYQEIWKALTPEERREWLADFVNYANYAANPFIYHPDGAPSPPDIQPAPESNLLSESDTVITGGYWVGVDGSGGVARSPRNPREQEMASLAVVQGGGGGIAAPSAPTKSSPAALKNLFQASDFEWGAAPMTRKRFWAGEMMAHFEGTPYTNLADLDLETLVLGKVSNGDGTTPVTPLLSFIPEVMDVVEGLGDDASEDPIYTPSDFEQHGFAPSATPDAVDEGALDQKHPKPPPESESKSPSAWWLLAAGTLIVIGGKVIVDRKR